MRFFRRSSLAAVPLASLVGLALLPSGCSSAKSDDTPATTADAGESVADVAANEVVADTEYQQGLQDISAAYQTCVDAKRCAIKSDGTVMSLDDAGAPVTTTTTDAGAGETSDAGADDASAADAGSLDTDAGASDDGGSALDDGGVNHRAPVIRDGVTHTDGLVSTVTGLLSSVPNKICQILTPIQDYKQVFFFIGGSATGADVVAGVIGADEVWDLWDQQSAGFWYKGKGLGSLVGVGASVYTGFGLGKDKANVIDAWSGYFKSAGVGFNTPLAQLGVTGSIFVGSATGATNDFDNSIVGGSISADVGINLNPLPLGALVSVNVQQAYWTPQNNMTEAIGALPWWAISGSSSTTHATAADGKSYEMTQYPNSRSIAFSVFNGSPGPLAPTAASIAIAFGVLKSHNWTIKNICGASATQDAGAGSLVH